jgi:hypothetical protein
MKKPAIQFRKSQVIAYAQAKLAGSRRRGLRGALLRLWDDVWHCPRHVENNRVSLKGRTEEYKHFGLIANRSAKKQTPDCFYKFVEMPTTHLTLDVAQI